MSTPTFGRIDPFNAETESLTSYLERMALYLQTNEMPVVEKRSDIQSSNGAGAGD